MSIHVSDHAAVRYCERVLGFDRKALGRAMDDLTAGMSGRFKLPGHDVQAVVENGVVITFVPVQLLGPQAIKTAAKKKKKTRQRLARHVPWPDDQ